MDDSTLQYILKSLHFTTKDELVDFLLEFAGVYRKFIQESDFWLDYIQDREEADD